MKRINNKQQSSLNTRWRLILGHHADDDLPFDRSSNQGNNNNVDANDDQKLKQEDNDDDQIQELNAQNAQEMLESRYEELDESLAYLYDREYDPLANIGDDISTQSYQLMDDLWEYQKDRSGGVTGSKLLTIPHWVNTVNSLFPKEAQEILTKDAIQRYNLSEILTDPEVLETIEPSFEIVKVLLSFRDYLSGRTLEIAKTLIKKVVKQLEDQFQQEIRTAILGRKQRYSRSPLEIAKNLDIKRTITYNLRHYDPQQQTIVIERLFFNNRIHKKQEWTIVICVDQSGSMIDSVIHSAVIASIFGSINTLKTHLFVFDTDVVDLTDLIRDPVEVLMAVQLGGGTAIWKALKSAEQLIDRPDRTIIILITDFYEGGDPTKLFASVKNLHEAGVTLLGLTAISAEGEPDYSKNTAQMCVELGMNVLSVTPAKLADLISDIMRTNS